MYSAGQGWRRRPDALRWYSQVLGGRGRKRSNNRAVLDALSEYCTECTCECASALLLLLSLSPSRCLLACWLDRSHSQPCVSSHRPPSPISQAPQAAAHQKPTQLACRSLPSGPSIAAGYIHYHHHEPGRSALDFAPPLIPRTHNSGPSRNPGPVARPRPCL